MPNRLVAGLIAWLAIASLPALADAPDFVRVRATHPSSWAIITDRNHEPLQAIRVIHGPDRLDWVPLDDMPPALLQAVLLSEDHRFYHHHGVDWQAVLGAAWENLVYSTHRGASTLTMQLVGLLEPDLTRHRGGRSVDQKWRQINAAGDLENSWSKAQILEAYLNLAPFRGQLQGVHAAAEGLFQTNPAKLDPAASALLAALLRGPNASPASVSFRACLLARNMTNHRPGCAAIRNLANRHLHNPPVLFGNLDQAPLLAGQLPANAGEQIASTLDGNLQTLTSSALQTTLKQSGFLAGGILITSTSNNEVLAWTARGSFPVMTADNDLPDADRAILPLVWLDSLAGGHITPASRFDRLPAPPVTAIDPTMAPWLDALQLSPARLSAAEALDQMLPVTGTSQFPPDSLNAQLAHFGIQSRIPDGKWQITPFALAGIWQALANPAHACPATLRQGSNPPCQTLAWSPMSTQVEQWLADPTSHAPGSSIPGIPAAWLANQNACLAWQAGNTASLTILVWLEDPHCQQHRLKRNPASRLWNLLARRAENHPAGNLALDSILVSPASPLIQQTLPDSPGILFPTWPDNWLDSQDWRQMTDTSGIMQ